MKKPWKLFKKIFIDTWGIAICMGILNNVILVNLFNEVNKISFGKTMAISFIVAVLFIIFKRKK